MALVVLMSERSTSNRGRKNYSVRIFTFSWLSKKNRCEGPRLRLSTGSYSGSNGVVAFLRAHFTSCQRPFNFFVASVTWRYHALLFSQWIYFFFLLQMLQ